MPGGDRLDEGSSRHAFRSVVEPLANCPKIFNGESAEESPVEGHVGYGEDRRTKLVQRVRHDWALAPVDLDQGLQALPSQNGQCGLQGGSEEVAPTTPPVALVVVVGALREVIGVRAELRITGSGPREPVLGPGDSCAPRVGSRLFEQPELDSDPSVVA